MGAYWMYDLETQADYAEPPMPEPITICGVRKLHRGRVCGAPAGHDGPHNWVPKTVREE